MSICYFDEGIITFAVAGCIKKILFIMQDYSEKRGGQCQPVLVIQISSLPALVYLITVQEAVFCMVNVILTHSRSYYASYCDIANYNFYI